MLRLLGVKKCSFLYRKFLSKMRIRVGSAAPLYGGHARDTESDGEQATKVVRVT